MPKQIASLVKLVVAAALVLVAIDVAVFRSGLYDCWIEPASTAGSTIRATEVIERSVDPARRNILVLGNSQMGEGFSWQAADAAVQPGELHFVNGAIAGSTPRIWNYLLREIDPDADRFAAIVMMADYDPAASADDFTNRFSDISYLRTLLQLGDLADFPASFSMPDTVTRARRAILLPMQALHDDIAASLRAPWRRYRNAIRGRDVAIHSSMHYPGRDDALPPVRIDATTLAPLDWADATPALKAQIQGYLGGLRSAATPDQQAANMAYQGRWIGAIASRYRAANVPVIVFSPPRGPFHRELTRPPEITGAIASLASRGLITALPGDAFVELEQPDKFFDMLHMNRAGREHFSPMLARAVAPLVH